MRKVKAVQDHNKEPMELGKRVLLFAAVGIVILAVIVLMLIENQAGRLRITNNTDLKLEYVRAYFVDAEGMVGTPFEFENLEAKGKRTEPLKEYELLGREANLEIRFKFENYDKLFVDAGYFNDNFDGKINITFDEAAEEGFVKLKVKASNGLLSSRLIECDEVYDVDYVNGTIPD